jgi:flagellar motor switch protein FliG
MSGRIADQLLEEVEEASKPKVTEVEAAMGCVVGAIRQMEIAGDLLFTSEEEEEAS